MTTVFPALTPSARTITPGSRDFEDVGSGGGDLDRVRISAALVGQTMDLGFTALDLSDLQLIRTHWLEARGTSGVWDLSDEVWGGVPRAVDLTPAGYQWRYAASPKTTTRGGSNGQLFNVTMTLRMVPPAQIPSGADLTIQVPSVSVLVSVAPPVVDADLLVTVPSVNVVVTTVPPSVDAE